jgi:anti-anti-sigma factor
MAKGEVRTQDSTSPSGPAVVVISGEADLAIAPVIREHIGAALDKHCDIVADLSEATFIDSVVLGVLTWALDVCENAGTRLFLIAGDQRVLRVFELTGVVSSFTIFESRAALSAQIGLSDDF